MSKKRISYEELKRLGACRPALRAFNKQWKGAPLATTVVKALWREHDRKPRDPHDLDGDYPDWAWWLVRKLLEAYKSWHSAYKYDQKWGQCPSKYGEEARALTMEYAERLEQ